MLVVALALAAGILIAPATTEAGVSKGIFAINRNYEASIIAERIRHLVENTVITNTDGQELQVTISAGITTSRPQDTPELILKRADELMYQSKHNGRNRVTTDGSAEDI